MKIQSTSDGDDIICRINTELSSPPPTQWRKWMVIRVSLATWICNAEIEFVAENFWRMRRWMDGVGENLLKLHCLCTTRRGQRISGALQGSPFSIYCHIQLRKLLRGIIRSIDDLITILNWCWLNGLRWNIVGLVKKRHPRDVYLIYDQCNLLNLEVNARDNGNNRPTIH